jgi:hypothetical protein
VPRLLRAVGHEPLGGLSSREQQLKLRLQLRLVRVFQGEGGRQQGRVASIVGVGLHGGDARPTGGRV